MRHFPSSLTIALLLGTATPLFAQAPPAPATPPAQTAPPSTSGPANCAPTTAVPGDSSIAPQGQKNGGEPLTDKLARTDGVLCPPAGVDPEMRAPAPNVGTTPVIPPPGSPGNNSDVRPK